MWSRSTSVRKGKKKKKKGKGYHALNLFWRIQEAVTQKNKISLYVAKIYTDSEYMWCLRHMCYQISADQPMGMNTVKNISTMEGERRGSLLQDAWNIKMQRAGQSYWWEHSGDAAWRSLDWAKCRGQGRIIKRLEHTPSGTTEGRMGNINRELYLLGKARRWKHWLRLFCWLGGTLWFMCWWRRNI